MSNPTCPGCRAPVLVEEELCGSCWKERLKKLPLCVLVTPLEPTSDHGDYQSRLFASEAEATLWAEGATAGLRVSGWNDDDNDDYMVLVLPRDAERVWETFVDGQYDRRELFENILLEAGLL